MSGATWLLIAMAAFSLYTTGVCWRFAFRVWGKDAFGFGLRVLRLRLRQPLGFGGGRYAVLVLGIAIVLLDWRSWTTMLAWLVLLSQVAMLSLPPFLVFLAASSDESQQLYNSVRWATPGHTMALIRRRTLDWFFHASSWRARDDLWVAAVRDLLSIARIVVVDTRGASQALIDEARWLGEAGRPPATLLITTESGTGALLEALDGNGIDLGPLRATRVPVSSAAHAVEALTARVIAGRS